MSSVLQATDPGVLDSIGRLVLAAGAGAAIGFERELDGHEAGTRTHALLALGASLFGLLSVGAFGSFVTTRADTNVQVDVTRIASYVVAGVGFIAAGAILKGPNRIRGLTTSASLWVTAAAGLAAGLGFWVGVVATTVVALLLLLLDRPMKALSTKIHRSTPTSDGYVVRMEAVAKMGSIAFDCPDPMRLAEFYGALLGTEIERVDTDWVQLRRVGQGPTLAFQLAPDHQPPRWPDPDHPQQVHLDLVVADLDQGEQRVLALGARKAQVQPGETFRVFIDPAGHPFCLVLD